MKATAPCHTTFAFGADDGNGGIVDQYAVERAGWPRRADGRGPAGASRNCGRGRCFQASTDSRRSRMRGGRVGSSFDLSLSESPDLDGNDDFVIAAKTAAAYRYQVNSG